MKTMPIYVSPIVEIIEVQVEQGFAGSSPGSTTSTNSSGGAEDAIWEVI